MKFIWLFTLLFPIIGVAQTLQYTPNRKLDITVAKTYYDTEFIFIKNISDNPIPLEFEVIDNSLQAEWSATFCTNAQCFSTIPNSGELGLIDAGGEAYFSFNFAANETIGEGQLRILITSQQNNAIKDTITFKYTVTEDGTTKARPWANVNYAQGVLNVLLENPHLVTTMQVVNIEGKIIFDAELGHITSVPLRDYPAGLYLVIIRDENERMIRQKVIHF